MIVFMPVPQFPMGFSVAASVRVGNALGAGNTEQAKLSSKVALICACMSQICSLVNLLLGSVPLIYKPNLFSKSCAMFVNLDILLCSSLSLCPQYDFLYFFTTIV